MKSRVLLGIADTVEELSKRSLLQRALWRDDISARIQRGYKEIENAAKEFNVRKIEYCHPTDNA